jgi:hypothetical protein
MREQLIARFVMLVVTVQLLKCSSQYRVQTIMKITIALREVSCLQSVRLDILLKTKKLARYVHQVSIVGQHQTTVTTELLTIVRMKRGIYAEVEVGLPTLKLMDLITFNTNLVNFIVIMDQ